MEEIYPNLFYFNFDNQRGLSDSFKRFYGHYESPKLKGKVFSEKQFDSWFRRDTVFGKDLDLSFSDIVGGVNIPDYVFDFFICGKFDPLSISEKKVISEIKNIKSNKFYVISAIDKEYFDLNHEVAHGLYYLNLDYRRRVDDILDEIGKRNYSNMEKYLIEEGVTHNDNLRDEIHAHLLTNHYVFFGRIKEDALNNLNKEIENLFFDFFKSD